MQIKDGRVRIEASDSLSTVAYHLTGSASRWPDLLKHNPKLQSPAGVRQLTLGEELIIPPEWEGLKASAPPSPVSLVTRGPDGRARVAQPGQTPPAKPSGEAPDLGRLAAMFAILDDWAENANTVISDQHARIELLEAAKENAIQRIEALEGAMRTLAKERAAAEEQIRKIIGAQNENHGLTGAPTEPAPHAEETPPTG